MRACSGQETAAHAEESQAPGSGESSTGKRRCPCQNVSLNIPRRQAGNGAGSRLRLRRCVSPGLAASASRGRWRRRRGWKWHKKGSFAPFSSRVILTILHRAEDVVHFVEKTLTQLRTVSEPLALRFPWARRALYDSFLLHRVLCRLTGIAVNPFTKGERPRASRTKLPQIR